MSQSEQKNLKADAPRDAQSYESPSIRDLGSLTELTLSGNGPLSDAFGGAAGGGS